ncbi:exosome non-catalytic core subunit rrp40 [Nowakowskiella sp. JEL0407]|nr:exosome non-catalytic core subunit rrp40 [Nowakowskiella sp. JEL0407]
MALVLFPSETVPNEYSLNDSQDNNGTPPLFRIGPGLLELNNNFVATKAGFLKTIPNGNKLWLETSQKRYVPVAGEPVIGIVTNTGSKHGEFFRLDIGTAHSANLGFFAFEAVTKKNRPNFTIGTLVYARISAANKDMDPELDCINPKTGKSDGYGELKSGFMFKCSLGLCRRLLDPKNPLLVELGAMIPFEVAVGMNGRVWVNSGTPKNTILVYNAILKWEFVDPRETKKFLKKFLSEYNI